MYVEIEHHLGHIVTVYDDWTYDSPVGYPNKIEEAIQIHHNSKGMIPADEYGIQDDGTEVFGEQLVEHTTEHRLKHIALNLMQDGRFVDYTIYE